MSKRLTQEEIIRIEENGKAKVINPEIHDNYKVTVCCTNNTSHVWDANYYNLMNGSGCPDCRYKIKYTTETYNDSLKRKSIPIQMIGDYIGHKSETQFQCLINKNHVFSAIPSHVYNGDKQCPFCLQDQNMYRHIDIMNDLIDCAKSAGYKIISPYINEHTPIRCICLNNPNHIFSKLPEKIRKKTGCLECFKLYGKYLNNHNNCLSIERPDIAQYLLNPEDGEKYSYGSNQKVYFVCPICESKIYKRIADVCRYGLTCKNCSAIGSYPNRFMFQLLKQLKIEFVNEFNCEWTQGKYFDFYFEKDKKYFIEMDGIFHSEGIYRDVSIQQESDLSKDKIAFDNGVCLIRIDCNYHKQKDRYTYIKNNILNSKLSVIFDLSIIDFDYCDFYAQSPYITLITECWNNGIRELSELSNIIGINKDSISKILKRSCDYNLISETPEEVHKILRTNGMKIASKKQKQTKANKKISA